MAVWHSANIQLHLCSAFGEREVVFATLRGNTSTSADLKPSHFDLMKEFEGDWCGAKRRKDAMLWELKPV